MKIAKSYHFDENYWNNKDELSEEEIEELKQLLIIEFDC